MADILLIDDDTRLRDYLCGELKRRGHAVESLDCAEDSLDRLAEARFDVIVLDNKMPRVTGLEFLAEIRSRGIEIPVILMTASHAFATLMEANKLGAFKYVIKPADRPALVEILQSEIEAVLECVQESARMPNVRFEPQDPPEPAGKQRPVGKSKSMLEVGHRIARYANSSYSVLIWGETGTGKELVARAIHDFSPRQGKPFVPVNCGAINLNLAESELFGHRKGAFTGADRDHAGYFEQANGGTLFLDEIGEMPLGLQAKLLRVLEDREVRRLHGTEPIKVDVRVLAATHCDLPGMVREGTFREDLYSRLNCFDIPLPPLRERLEDLPDLIHCFLEQEAGKTGRRLAIAEATLEALRAYHWPRNVRQLKHIIANAFALCQATQILPQDIKFPADSGAKPDSGTKEEAVAALQKVIAWAFKTGGSEVWKVFHELVDPELAKAAVERCGDKRAAAERLDISRNTLNKLLKEDELKE